MVAEMVMAPRPTNPFLMQSARLGPGDPPHLPARFANHQQEAFFYSEAPEVLYSGAFGAGKSRIGCEKAYYLAQSYPGIPIGIFRKFAASLRASTETTLLEVMGRGPLRVVRSNATDHFYELANGSTIRLFGLDPSPATGGPQKVGSVELGWAFVDEAVELTETDWEMVKGRVRWSGGIPFFQVTAATNPAGPNHWLKRRFTPPSAQQVYLHATTLDNPLTPQAYRDQQMAQADGYRKRRTVMGEWVSAEGQIWPLPDDAVRDPDPAAKWSRTIGAIDWGYKHAFAAEVGGVASGHLAAVIDELYAREETLDHLIPRLLELQKRYKVETWYADPSEPAYIRQCQDKGLNVVPAKNDVLPGINAVLDAIALGLTISPACDGLLLEIPDYTWAKDRSTDGFKEKPIEIGDDACDALRYLAMGARDAGYMAWLRAERERLAAERAATPAVPPAQSIPAHLVPAPPPARAKSALVAELERIQAARA